MDNTDAIKLARKLVATIRPNQAVQIECFFYQPRCDVYTKKNTVKRSDASNRLKAAHDAISDLIGIDDSHFFFGTFSKCIAKGQLQEYMDVIISIKDVDGF